MAGNNLFTSSLRISTFSLKSTYKIQHNYVTMQSKTALSLAHELIELILLLG